MSQHYEKTVDNSEPNNIILLVSLLVSFVVFFFIVYFSIIYFKAETSKVLNLKQQTSLSDERQALIRYEADVLHGYVWINESKGHIRVPIEIAMDDVIESYR